jgi:hypothetical protein
LCDDEYNLGALNRSPHSNQVPQKESELPVKDFKVSVMLLISVITELVLEEYWDDELGDKETYKYFRDINYLSYCTKFESLKDDQKEKIREICKYSEHGNII